MIFTTIQVIRLSVGDVCVRVCVCKSFQFLLNQPNPNITQWLRFTSNISTNWLIRCCCGGCCYVLVLLLLNINCGSLICDVHTFEHLKLMKNFRVGGIFWKKQNMWKHHKTATTTQTSFDFVCAQIVWATLKSDMNQIWNAVDFYCLHFKWTKKETTTFAWWLCVCVSSSRWWSKMKGERERDSKKPVHAHTHTNEDIDSLSLLFVN